MNSLMGEELDTNFRESSISGIMTTAEMRYDRSTATLRVDDNAIGSLLRIYSTDGSIIASRQIVSSAISLADVKADIFLVRIDGTRIAPRVMKIRK